MRIQAFQTGTVRMKRSFLHPGRGPRRRLNLVLPGEWSDPMPIGGWLIEHGDERILVDAGENADPKDAPFARHSVTAEDELPAALAAIGSSPAEVTTAVFTHLHPDHYNGAVHLRLPVLVDEAEWADATSFRGRMIQKLSGAPLPDSVDFRQVRLDDGPFGSFAASRKVTADGRILMVSTPGHTAGHCSVLAIDDDGRHVLLAGDATDTMEQLHARRADAITPDPALQIKTIGRILDHAAEHPTIYLPTHDPDSSKRLHSGEPLQAA